MVFGNNFWPSKDTIFILTTSRSSCQDASNELYIDLKRSCWKYDLRSWLWPDRKSQKVMLHISRSVWSAWTQLWCFHRFSLSLSKVTAEKLLMTFHDLKTEVTSGTWGRVTGRNFPMQCIKSTCYPMFEIWECFECFSSKRGGFQFSAIDL